jgi:hypothetical protein
MATTSQQYFPLLYHVVNAKVLLTHFANLEVTHPERISEGESRPFSGRGPIFDAGTLSIDGNRFGRVKKPIKQSCCQHNASKCLLLSLPCPLKSGQILG